MRQLATIQKILNIRPIPGADLIEVVDVLGWSVVTQKGNFQVGDFAIYFEVDSFLNAEDKRYESFEERFINWNGKRGMRLKTIKLRKQISQGLVLPLKEFPEIKKPKEGDDVTELLKIEKWEPAEEVSANNGGHKVVDRVKRDFPRFIFKTDQERVQNIGHILSDYLQDTFEKTIKLDGSSMTVYHVGDDSPKFKQILADAEEWNLKKLNWYGKLLKRVKGWLGLNAKPKFIQGVCSREREWDIDSKNHFAQYVRDNQLLDTLENFGRSIAIQGELIAPSIQNNYEKVNGFEYYVFDIFDINEQRYLLPEQVREIVEELGLKYVPVLATNAKITDNYTTEGVFDVRALTDSILADAEGPGMNSGVKREGIVWKSNTTQFSFKSISNSYLLKKQD